MGELLSQVLPLALGSTISPTLLTVTLVVLASKEKPRARGLFFLLGLLAVLAGIGVVVLAAGAKSVHSTAPHAGDRAAIVDLVLAALLLGLAVRTLAHNPDPHKHDKRKPKPERHGVQARRYFVFGAIMMVLNFSTVILYIDALKDVAHADVSTIDRGVVWVILAMFASLPAVIPLIGYVVAPGPAERGLGKLNAFLVRHAHVIGASVCFVFAAYLAIKGVTELS